MIVDRDMMKYEDCLGWSRREDDLKKRQAPLGFLSRLFQKKKIFTKTWHQPFLTSFKIPKQSLNDKVLHHESTKHMLKNIPRKVEQLILTSVDNKVFLLSNLS